MIAIHKVTGDDDLTAIRDLALRIWPHTYKAILSEEQFDYMLDMMYSLQSLKNQLNTGHIMYILKHNDEPSGFVSYEYNHPESGTTKIHKIYLLPECQGLGLGKKLLSHAEEDAKSNQQTSLLLNVNKYNKAIEFYKHCGFEIFAEEVIEIGRGYMMDDYQMKKFI